MTGLHGAIYLFGDSRQWQRPKLKGEGKVELGQIQETALTAVGVGGGVIGGGAFVGWLMKRYIMKVDNLVKGFAALASSFDAWKEVNRENKVDIKDHEKRLTILEPKIQRAHERLDSIQRSNH